MISSFVGQPVTSWLVTGKDNQTHNSHVVGLMLNITGVSQKSVLMQCCNWSTTTLSSFFCLPHTMPPFLTFFAFGSLKSILVSSHEFSEHESWSYCHSASLCNYILYTWRRIFTQCICTCIGFLSGSRGQNFKPLLSFKRWDPYQSAAVSLEDRVHLSWKSNTLIKLQQGT